MALDIIQPMRFEIDLRDGLVQKPQRTQLMKGDKNANRVVIALTDGGKAVDLTGATVTGSFISPVEEAKIPLTGSVNGNEASVTLIEECYAEDGFYQLDVELTVGETRRTIVSMTGYVLRKGSGAVIDIGDVIPSIDDIIAQYATMKQVTQETQTAADNANAARDGANEAKENANAAAEAANEAAQAAEGWANAEMTAETLAQGSAATAEVTTGADGHKIIKLGIPRGDTGLTPQITFDVSTGAAGTDVQIEQSGTPEEPVIHLTIPRGDTGAIDGLDYYEGDPAPLGEASPGDVNSVARGNHVHPMPTAEEVGARPDDWMPEIRKVYDRNGENYAEITVSDNGVGIYDSIHGSRLYFNTNSGLTTVYDADDNVLNRLYGTGYKPTPDDIGALPSDGTAADAQKLGGKEPSYYIQPAPSLLGNGNFANPVNQRGGASYAYGSTKVTIDRWTTYAALTVNDGYISVSNTGSETYNLYQHFPLGTFAAGKWYTGAIMLRDGTVYAGSAQCVDGSAALFYYTGAENFSVGLRKNMSEKDSFYVSVRPGMTLDIVWAALYEGQYAADALPPYAPKGYAQELLECQRYFYYASKYAAWTGYKSTTPFFYITVPTRMIDTPTVTADYLVMRGSIEGEGGSNDASISEVLIGAGNNIRVTCVCDALSNNQPLVAVTTGLAVSAEP